MSPKKHDDLKTSVADASAGNWGDGTRVQFLYKGGPQMVPSCSGMQRLTTPLVQHPETPAHPTARSTSPLPSPLFPFFTCGVFRDNARVPVPFYPVSRFWMTMYPPPVCCPPRARNLQAVKCPPCHARLFNLNLRIQPLACSVSRCSVEKNGKY